MIEFQLPEHTFTPELYEVYYHPQHNIIGLSKPGLSVVRVYLDSDARTFIGKTDLWVKIGEL